LGVAVAEIAFKNLVVNGIEVHGAERAYGNTSPAANAGVVIDIHPVLLIISGNGAHGTSDHTGGILALLTRHGDV
jgi:hypothetical protein